MHEYIVILFFIYLHFITGLKYVYLLIIFNYCVRVEEPNQPTVNQFYQSVYQPTYSQSNLPIYLSTDLQSIIPHRPHIVLQKYV